MLTSVLRVVSRAATIQLEEVAARHGPATLASRARGQAPAPSDPSWYPPPPNATASLTTETWEKELPPIRRGDRIDGDPLPVRQNVHAPTRTAGAADDLAVGADAASTTTGVRSGVDREVEEDLKQLEAMLGEAGGAPSKTTPYHSPETSTPAQPVTEDPLSAMATEGRPMDPSPTGHADANIPPTTDKWAQMTDRATKLNPFQTTSGPVIEQEPVVEAPSIDGFSQQPAVGTPDPTLEGPPGVPSAVGELPPEEPEEAPVLLRASKVPSSKLGRLFHYGSLAASLSWGAASESIRRTAVGGGTQGSSVFMSDANVRRLVSSLTRMRGAALKLGQFMSIQDNNMLPPEIEKVLQQVQAHANYMPDWQMEKVMKAELGADWASLFTSFDRTPIASASIGQVHRAVLASTGETVAVKIQFPGIQESISSDLSYLTPLLASSSILPRGLYLQNTIAVMKRELADECDYVREAESGRKFAELLEGDEYFDVPKVVDEASTARVLTTTWMEGKPLSRMKNMSQETRDKIGTNILRLCLIELFQFRFMQTDPNWANFLYNASTDRLGLIDFGASREYTPHFMDAWHALLTAALEGDREGMREQSLRIGYFTGEEEEIMVDAHLSSMSLLAVPFAHQGIYDFSKQTITTDVRKYIPIMLKHRLTPPPPETYSLNRKLSGAFLMCARLGSRVDCSELWRRYVAGYKKSAV